MDDDAGAGNTYVDDVTIEDDNDLIHDSLSDLETHAVELAKLAINFDNQNQWEPARYYYQVFYSIVLLFVT